MGTMAKKGRTMAELETNILWSCWGRTVGPGGAEMGPHPWAGGEGQWRPARARKTHGCPQGPDRVILLPDKGQSLRFKRKYPGKIDLV